MRTKAVSISWKCNLKVCHYCADVTYDWPSASVAGVFSEEVSKLSELGHENTNNLHIRNQRLAKAVLMSTHNLCFGAIRKIGLGNHCTDMFS